MASLDRTLRRQLENTVKQARRVAEAGARKTLESLAVHHHEPHSSMSSEQRALRNRLRAHGRQLGDRRDERRGTQSIDRLVGECAYEHWHRMLFARFLAENDLLIEPESGVAITLEECRELARDQALDWLELASSYAVRMLQEVFRADDPVLEVVLALETRSELEDLLKSLPSDVFLADDSLGWCYQFWQAERKDEVNASGNKIGAEELPAVTQLFTEDYMVDFLLDNTLGAWHAGKVLTAKPALAETAQGEEELRDAAALPGCPWKYLRFIKGEDGKWTPASGTFEGWPKLTHELKCLDPCMGSGHFVVAMFQRLVALRLGEESLDEAAAVAAVINDNLFGLEIDPRCTQIGAFNLALAAWRRVGYHRLPAMKIACSGIAPNAKREDWLELTEEAPNLRFQMGALYDLFGKAPILGSLINPSVDEAVTYGGALRDLKPLLEKAKLQETKDDTEHEMAVTAHGLFKAAEILSGQFTLVTTNVPYLGRRKQDQVLQDYCDRAYEEAKADLATCFVRRCLEFCASNGSAALVTPQNWLFLKTYQKLRKNLLNQAKWDYIARLGPKCFKTPMWDFNVALLSLTADEPRDEDRYSGIDVGTEKNPALKAKSLESKTPISVLQKDQLNNPDSRITLGENVETALLKVVAGSTAGMLTGDGNHFCRSFWEPIEISPNWEFLQSTVSKSILCGGRSQLVLWENGKGQLYEYAESVKHLNTAVQRWRTGQEVWGKCGVVVSCMGGLDCTLYQGDRYDNNVGVIVPFEQSHLPAIWAFCSSPQFAIELRRIDQKVNVTAATFVKVPFDLAHWQKVATEQYPNGLAEPYSNDPTQWVFHGHPCASVLWNEEKKHIEVASTPRTDVAVLQVAVARLLGYRWPAEKDGEMRLSAESRKLVARCTELHHFADADGIVCLSPIHKEHPASQRLTELLAATYGEDWSAARLNELLAAADCKGKTLDDWLRDKSFEQHVGLFHHRPFIWHIWDGLLDGFNALVNYHKLAAPNGEGRRTLEKLIYTYLGDWIAQQRRDQQAEVEGADARLAAALHLQDELKKILEGEPPYDIFVRWKPLHEQPIGWDPDINDGVRLNIRPFMMARPLNARAKNACILRTTPKNIKWKKDRGKEPERPKEDYPWFWGWDEKAQDFAGGSRFDGNRWNDLHYTNAFKQAARDQKKKG